MILRQIGSNQTEISFNNGTTLFFSYETPVAGHTILDGYFKTDTYYSRTTSKHINQYLKHADSYVKTVTNDYIVSLCHPEGLGAQYNKDMRDNSFDKEFLRTLTMTEDEECVLGEMVSFFNDMGWINESTQDAYDSLVEKYCEPSPFDYEPINPPSRRQN